MKKKNSRKGRIIRSTALTITPMLLAVAISGHWVLSIFQDDIRNKDLNDQLSDLVISETKEPEGEETPIVIETPDVTEEIVDPEPVEEEKPFERISSELFDIDYEIPEIDFDTLNEINPDAQAWIRIDGTSIDFPLVQGEDNQFYLKHDIESNSNINGAIFLDCRSNPLGSEMPELSDVSYIYGHHMKSGAMFASLCKFKEQAFLDEHPFGILRCENGDIYKLDFFSGMVIGGEDDSILYTDDFETEEDFQAYYDSVKEKAMVSSDMDLQLGDKVIALVTCSYETNNSRFVLYARMTKQLENINDYNQERGNNVVYTLN